MATTTRKPNQCPQCGTKQTYVTGQDGATPRPGDVCICDDCGGVNLFTTGGVREATPEELSELMQDPEIRAAIQQSRAASSDAKAAAAYNADYQHVRQLVVGWLKAHPLHNPPAFALGPKGVAIAACLSDLHRNLHRNAPARDLLAHVVAAEPRATLLMFEMVVEKLGLPFERVSLGDLGLKVGQS